MKFNWIYESSEKQQVKTFLRTKGISRGLLAKIKFQGGKIEVNHREENAVYYLEDKDQVDITIPDEKGYDTTMPIDIPIDIIYEDAHFLIVNKPYGVASIPSKVHPKGTMANRVKGYYVRENYIDQVIHIVTRLDRDTTGLMLFAKHGYAHALLDKELKLKQLHKKYVALVTGKITDELHGKIEAPIGRPEDSIIRRIVHPKGKTALTEYWVKERYNQATLVDVQLHTGRTHQIRVHFAHIGFPLMGDDLYGGEKNEWIKRQALHCRELDFIHPFTHKKIVLEADYPEDISEWLKHNNG
ncbi:RluA family pseudouridine synthase [Carnobacterium funditum]|uniref:RluA family pseudouridine synthase n=1 Tax=Carnobacterium funditum TaxID=2752 RepID=UPI0005582E9D|nr:RluA family pseudouridine synthase [Carnobacterium funditum]